MSASSEFVLSESELDEEVDDHSLHHERLYDGPEGAGGIMDKVFWLSNLTTRRTKWQMKRALPPSELLHGLAVGILKEDLGKGDDYSAADYAEALERARLVYSDVKGSPVRVRASALV